MRLEFSGSPEVAASRATVWGHLLDPEFVASCATGVDTTEMIDDSHFRVIVALGIGAISLRFVLEVEILDLDPPSSAKMHIRGKAPGSNIEMHTSVRLEELASDQTRLHWDATTEVRGSIASIGARLLKGTARRLTDEFWETFAQRAAV